MRKQIGSHHLAAPKPEDIGWLDLEQVAQVEVTSEDPEHPIESAFSPKGPAGWRARSAGRQTVRLIFDSPQILRLIHLVFKEDHESRTQEFVLRWSAGESEPFKEILRQQYNFTPGAAEIEDYAMNLENVKVLELEIEPSINGREVLASLAELRLR
jgi:hypothetical protein